ncbi:MAG: GLPGLI family protein [Bacteroidota bacterium]|nr:GLPGLI family protein [Bacteroidota bacterium]
MNTKILIFILLSASLKVRSQASLGGSVVYTRTTTYDFQSTGNAEWDAYAKTLPGEGKFQKQLLFTSESSLYNEAPISEESLPPEHQKALFFVNFGKVPKPTLKQLFIDFEKEESCVLLEFMTREFRVEDSLENRAWKLQTERKKIGEYTCMKATAILDGDEITAWFTPEIPVPAGPADYYGLPGLVLAVERLDETIFLATSVDLNAPDPELLVPPDAGKRTSPEDFDKIVEEKVKEYKQNAPSKSSYYQK